ncbi:MAG: aldehyde dehydrogenase [Bacillota bacterium]|nr:aldehyde dehydrogenase [Bacillota bacterium]
MNTTHILSEQRRFFATGATLPVTTRRLALQKLLEQIRRREPQIVAALQADLNKAELESYMCEIGIVREELRYMLRMLPKWARPYSRRAPLSQFPGRSYRYAEPYGQTLIIAPWNYPFQLTLMPLIGALAAGNTAIVKPSAYAPATSALLAELLGELFKPEWVAVVEGGRAANAELLAHRFDYIFFTGSPAVGKTVMEAAAKHLTPLTLELGGKSPVIVDDSAKIELAARRIAFGKYLNAGQTCVAPDYLLVHNSRKQQLLEALRQATRDFFGEQPLNNPELPRIINDKHFRRLLGLLQDGRIVFGGGYDEARLLIEPTVIDDISYYSPLMQEEIFGPLLPVIGYDDLQQVIGDLRELPKPLALYLFTEQESVKRQVLSGLRFGGGCVNDTIIHLADKRLSFGGVGDSGMGAYHGKSSFDSFSHYKSVVDKSTRFDLPMRYHPYNEKNLRLIKRFLK